MTDFTDKRQELLYRAVQISLFTWRRAEPDDPVDDEDRAGWWGDSFPGVANDRIGSRLWLLRRSKLLPETFRRAEAYAREALQWLIDDEVASEIAVTASSPKPGRLDLVIQLTDEGGDLPPMNFDNIWQVLNAL